LKPGGGASPYRRIRGQKDGWVHRDGREWAIGQTSQPRIPNDGGQVIGVHHFAEGQLLGIGGPAGVMEADGLPEDLLRFVIERMSLQLLVADHNDAGCGVACAARCRCGLRKIPNARIASAADTKAVFL
jgi:hypothetical protein